MSAYSIIEGTSTELRRQIFEALDSAPDTDFSLTDPASNITLDAPGGDLSSQFVVSLYLYHIDQNRHLRNQPPLRTGSDELRRPPLPLQLRYLVTPLDSETNNHLMLGRILQHCHDHPTIDSIEGRPLDTSHGGASSEIRIRLESLTLEQLAQIWNAFNQPFRLATVLLVEAVVIDSALSPEKHAPVRDTYTVVQQRTG
ncbi:DUF4255 domain-containing protein [Marinobacter lacisalsi]|uniref:DUF4255 domain-containing protein n=1 Tax=Marinobacter lacisalsi TaxID=475979 RepID=A0ABV8QKY7_9GAMM